VGAEAGQRSSHQREYSRGLLHGAPFETGV
jgi:hypothetical protein